MARKNIFELLEENNDFANDAVRLIHYFHKIDTLQFGDTSYTLKEAASDLFVYWKARGRCIHLDDFLETVGYNDLLDLDYWDIDDIIILIEIVYNLWYLASVYVKSSSVPLEALTRFFDLKKFMDQCLDQYNHEVLIFEEKEQVLIVEANQHSTAVAEIVDEELAVDILRYNHHALKGAIKEKKAILLAMASDLEASKKELHKINSQLEDDIFFMLNNMNIRHNNIKQGDKNYKEVVATMQSEELENWYDELYQMMLLAILEMDNVERQRSIKELKNKITGKA